LSLSAADRDDLKDYKIKNLGETVKMWCNDSVQYLEAPNDTQPVSWMLPNLTVLHVSAGRFEITDTQFALTVHNVTIDDIGQYHCMLRVRLNFSEWADWYLARLGLNAQGPYFEDLWDKYELNTIIGISSGFGFLALAVGAMLVYHFRYISPLDEEDETKQNFANGSTPFGAGIKSDVSEPDVAGTYNKAYDGDASLPPDSEASTSENSVPVDQDDGTAF